MTLSPEFVQAVREGRIEGLTYGGLDSSAWIALGPGYVAVKAKDGTFEVNQICSDHLCAHLRRWMVTQDFQWSLEDSGDLLVSNSNGGCLSFRARRYATELDRHVAAALWVLGREGK